MDIEFDVSEVMELVASLNASAQMAKSEIERAALKGGYIIQAESQSEAPVDIGNLKGSIRTKPITMGAEVKSHADYSKAVHDGTRPHKIVAKGKALRFNVGGSTIFAKSVNHPGTKANPFMRRGVDKSRVKVNKVFEDAGVAIAKKALGG